MAAGSPPAIEPTTSRFRLDPSSTASAVGNSAEALIVNSVSVPESSTCALEFGDRVERREIDDRRTRGKRAIIGGDIMRDIGQEQADPAAFADAALLQAARDAGDPRPRLRHS